ncbi:MAG TPA: hypothetical protein VG102_03860 [Candidatus Paceibacterota bacterium]|jgi:hypothetical protein|nr:hypothetical protein [Candidatus Paceibacterota bacterium]
MAVFAAIIFFLALILIIGLFTIKQWELVHNRVLFPLWRERADAEALHLKVLLFAARKDVEHLPPLLLYAARSIVHGIAVDAGHVAIWLGEQSHRLADTVSQRGFERRETRSEFLKKVGEHPIRNQNGSNGASNNGNGNGDTDTTSL